MNDTGEDDVTIERDGREEDGMSEEELEASESREGAKVAKVKKELDACKQEKQEYLDGWQRAKADYVNVLKRLEEEKKTATEQGTAKAVKAFMPAHDALARAKSAGDLPEGFAGIAKQLESAFDSFGIVLLGKPGEAFDPMKHEALGMDSTTSQDQDDTVSAVLEPGYMIATTVLRPARVRVFQYEG